MTTEQIVIIVESAVVLILLCVIAVFAVKRAKRKKGKADNVYVKNGVRYTRDETEVNEKGGVKITHREGDIILERGITYLVGPNAKILPGKYTVLSAQEKTESFNLRLGDFVREYPHACDIVLSDGETICAVSHNVILR